MSTHRQYADMAEVEHRYDVVVVGGGIGGLTVAYRIQCQRPDLRIVLFEGANHAGGKMRTKTVDHPDGRFLIEAGPDCFLAQKPWARELTEDLGLGEHLIPISSMARGVAIRKNGRTIDWPAGISLLAPTEALPFLRTSLFSPRGKIRMGMDLLIPKQTSSSDESVGALVRRRLGREALDWIAEPLMAGIYNADPDELSLMSTFPNLRTFEQEHGSLIRGLRAAKRNRRGSKEQTAPFLALLDGMQELPNALVKSLGDVVETGSLVKSFTRGSDGLFRLAIGGRRLIAASQVVLATPAKETAALLEAVSPAASAHMAPMRTSNSGTISMAFPESELAGPAGYGLVLPRKEGRSFNAVTVVSRKFPGRAPPGWALVRLFFGGARSPETMVADDQRVAGMAIRELQLLYGVSDEPAFYTVSRWPVGNPLYAVGHMERVLEIEKALPSGVHLGGSAFRGVGIPDIIRGANQTAARICESLAQGISDTFEQHNAVQQLGA